MSSQQAQQIATRYHTIIYLQHYQDEVLAELMEASDADGMARHLSQWDMGEYHDEPVPLGNLSGYDITQHSIEHAGDYLLVVHYGMGDASLLVQEQHPRPAPRVRRWSS